MWSIFICIILIFLVWADSDYYKNKINKRLYSESEIQRARRSVLSDRLNELKYEAQMRQLSFANIDVMEGKQFEEWCAFLLKESGFNNVHITRASGDQGVDILADKGNRKYAFQCKRYKTTLSNRPVQEVYTGMKIYKCDIGVVMTNNYFSHGAIEASKSTGVQLWNRDTIASMLSMSKMRNEQIINEEAKEIEKIQAEYQRNLIPPTKTQREILITNLFSYLKFGTIVLLFICIFLIPILKDDAKKSTDSSPVTSSPTAETSSASNDLLLRIFSSIPHLENIRFDMSQVENNRIIEKYTTDLDKISTQTSEIYPANILFPELYPKYHSGHRVCCNECYYSNRFKYKNFTISAISFYYVYKVKHDKIQRDPNNSLLYGVKIVFLTETPTQFFEELFKAIEEDCGKCIWQGDDPRTFLKIQNRPEYIITRNYAIWGSKDSVVGLSSIKESINPGVGEIELSIVNHEINEMIYDAIQISNTEKRP